MRPMTKPAKKKFRRSDPATKGDIMDIRAEMKSDMSAMEYRILEQMGLLLENFKHDIVGATKDGIDSLKTRVTRLERHTGLAAAA